MTKGKLGYPWIDAHIRALIRKRENLYHKARRTDNDPLKSRYKRLRAFVQTEIRDAYWSMSPISSTPWIQTLI